MVSVKIFGLLRLDSGIKALELQGKTVGQVLSALPPELDRKQIKRCTLLVNGKAATARTKLNEGDELIILSPVAGG